MMYVKILFLNEYFRFLFVIQPEKLGDVEQKYKATFNAASAAVRAAEAQSKPAEEIKRLKKIQDDEHFKYIYAGFSAERALIQLDSVLTGDLRQYHCYF